MTRDPLARSSHITGLWIILFSSLPLQHLPAQEYFPNIPRVSLPDADLRHPPPDTQFSIDLQPVANLRLDQPLNSPGVAGNDLKELPPGDFRTTDGIRFRIDKRLIALSGKHAPDDRPDDVSVKVDRKSSSLYFLHACGWGGFGAPAHPHSEKDGTLIGYYRVNYDDGDYEIIPIVYGKDVRDWWGIWDKFQPTRNSTIAWRGNNAQLKQRPEAKNEPQPLRLFLTCWPNPWPASKIRSIQYVSTGGAAAPFCVAITGSLLPTDDPRRNPALGAAESPQHLHAQSRRSEPGYRAIYSLDPQGRDLKFVFDAPGMISTATPDLSHDGQYLLCDAIPELDAVVRSRIFLVALRGPFAGVVRDLGHGNTPVWSPDDKKIAFMLNHGNPDAREPGIWIMNADGTEPERLGNGIYPQWSPDGEKLCVDAGENLLVYDLADSRESTLLPDELRSEFGGAVWSRDGKQFAFILKRDGFYSIALIDADGNPDSLRIIYTEKRPQQHLVGPPSLSPDGSRILFAIQDLSGTTPPARQWLDTRIYSIPAQLDSQPAPLEAEKIGSINRGMRWTPDGTRILFSSERPR